MGSKPYNFSWVDFSNWMTNAVIFFAPAALVFLLEIQAGSNFEKSLIALKVWGLNSAIDFLRKFIADTR